MSVGSKLIMGSVSSDLRRLTHQLGRLNLERIGQPANGFDFRMIRTGSASEGVKVVFAMCRLPYRVTPEPALRRLQLPLPRRRSKPGKIVANCGKQAVGARPRPAN